MRENEPLLCEAAISFRYLWTSWGAQGSGGLTIEQVIAVGEICDSALRVRSPRAAEVIELRFFGGLTVLETAEVLNVSKTTVDERLSFAKAMAAPRINGVHPERVMHPSDESRLEEGFARARAQSEENRVAFLDAYAVTTESCGVHIQELLQHDRDDDGLLERPAMELKSVRDALANPPAFTGRRVGPYQIVDELWPRRHGRVYLGRRADGSFDKKVAIKVLDRFHSISSDEARFRQERHVPVSSILLISPRSSTRASMRE